MTDSEIPYSCSGSGGKPEETRKAMRDMLGPQAVDWFIRHAISTCWMMLPDNKKNVTQVEAEIRRLVERAVQNLREDARSFGTSETPGEREPGAGNEIPMAVFETTCDGRTPEEARKAMRDILGPQGVDHFIRGAISTCWLMLPGNKRNVAEVEAEIRRLVERIAEPERGCSLVWHLGDFLNALVSELWFLTGDAHGGGIGPRGMAASVARRV